MPGQATVVTPQYRHEVLLYRGVDDFVSRVAGVIRAAPCDAAVLVATDVAKADRLRESLGPEPEVRFVDLRTAGRNPGRIIGLWRDFVDEAEAASRPALGFGEPVWPGRSAAELAECRTHEVLLNSAFADAVDFRLVCPYDLDGLPARVIDDALAEHPLVLEARRAVQNPRFDPDAVRIQDHLPEPAVVDAELGYELRDLARIRGIVRARAEAAGCEPRAIDDLVLAVNEVATNSIRHGGGRGRLRVWTEHGAVVCEVRDAGQITDPLAGRLRPDPGSERGYGLWLAQQTCDLVELRTGPAGTTVRLHTSSPPPAGPPAGFGG